MSSRRDFLTGLSGIGAAAAMFRGDAIARASGAGRDAAQTPPHELAREEDYWSQIQRAFDVDRTRINFNNGGVCPSPRIVQDAMRRQLEFSNMAPAYTLWTVLEPEIESTLREKLQRGSITFILGPDQRSRADPPHRIAVLAAAINAPRSRAAAQVAIADRSAARSHRAPSSAHCSAMRS